MYLSQFYEIVIFTTQYHYVRLSFSSSACALLWLTTTFASQTAMPVLNKLDPYQFYIIHRLFRDACQSKNGQPVKDLKYLNRDLSKVILLDTHPKHVTPNPENTVVLAKWTSDIKDRGLIAMIPFLECMHRPSSLHYHCTDASHRLPAIAIFKTPDVRPVLQAYEGKNIPIEYAKKEAEMKRKHIKEWEHSHKGLLRGGLTLSGLFGSAEQVSIHTHMLFLAPR